MPNLSRKSVAIGLILLVLLATGLWFYTHRTEQIEMASYVPESALGYLEINNLPQTVDQMTSTQAWQQLAPAYGIPTQLNYIGKLGRTGWLARLFGNSEAAFFSQAQFAIVVTSLEVRGEAVKPRLALLAETHLRTSALHDLAETKLPELARTLFGQTTKETSEYGGVPIVSFAAPGADRKLMAAQIEGELILANHEEPLRASIDARLGKAPSLANNFYLPKARPAAIPSGKDASVFGFVTAEGVKRLLRFGTYMAAGGVVGKAALAGAVGEAFTDFSTKTCDGIAYGASIETGPNGTVVVDRYALLFKPELTEKLKSVVKANLGELNSLKIVPATAREITVINVVQPSKTLDGIEAVISSRIDAAQSFLLHQFAIGMREAAFGKEPGGKEPGSAKPGEQTNAAIGDEIVSFNSTKEPQDRLWLVAVKDRAMMSQLVENALTFFQDKRIATINRESVSDFELLNSSEPSRGSAMFIGNFLALGKREQLLRLIETQRSGQNLKSAPRFNAASKPSLSAPLLSFSSVKEESGEMMNALARLLGLSLMPANPEALEQLPFAASAISINDQGLLVESRSSFGNFPFLLSLISLTAAPDGSNNRQ